MWSCHARGRRRRARKQEESMMTRAWAIGLISMCAPLFVACVAEPDDASKYREPLPAQGSVALALPRSDSSSTGTHNLDLGGGSGSGDAPAASSAEFYR